MPRREYSIPAKRWKRGDRFTLRHWTDVDTGKPLVCVVTMLRYGCIYYRPDYGTPDAPVLGAGGCFPIGEADKRADPL